MGETPKPKADDPSKPHQDTDKPNQDPRINPATGKPETPEERKQREERERQSGRE